MNRENLQTIIPTLAQKHNFNPFILEKDFYLTHILNHVLSHLSDKLIFKGGTLLNKIHLNYHRLSEDLDFTYLSKEELKTRSKRSRAITPIREKMPGFLKFLDLKSENPKGEGFNNSTQYNFSVSYSSFITEKDEGIKIEISLRQNPMEKPITNTIDHFYKDPFTNKDLIPKNKVLSLTLNEAVAEKLKASITRLEFAIRDYYDLWHIAESGFDFHNKRFISIFKRKLENENYKGDYNHNFGLDENSIEELKNQIETDLIPVIRMGESFNLDKVFERFNRILKDI